MEKMGTIIILTIALVAVGGYLVWNIMKTLKQLDEFEL